MDILRFKQFEEVELKLKDLETRNRGNILANKLASGGTFSKIGGGEISFPNMRTPDLSGVTQSSIGVGYLKDPATQMYSPGVSGEYLATRGSQRGTRYRNVFVGDDGEYSLKNILKTKEFGSGGSGVRTQLFETIQTIFISMRQDGIRMNPRNAEERFKWYVRNNNHLNKVFSKVPINENMIDSFQGEKNWIYNFTKLPNELYREEKRHIDIYKKYIFFHESYNGDIDSPYQVILNKVNTFLRDRDNQVPITNIAKFCPADVYLIDRNSHRDIIRQLLEAESIQRLSDTMDELFSEKLLVPISMKMLGPGVRFKLITNNKLNPKNDTLAPVKFKFKFASITGDFKRGIGSAIVVSAKYQRDTRDRIMLIQSPSTSRNNNAGGEVIGSTSRGHGKISFNRLDFIFKKYLTGSLRRLPLDTFSKLNSLQEIDLYRKLERTYRIVYNNIHNYKGIGNSKMGGRIIITDKKTMNRNKVISKIQSLQMIRIILEMKLSDARSCNKMLSEIFKYALSIQIFNTSGEKINTPNYLRVI